MSNYTTDFYGNPAYPAESHYLSRPQRAPYILGAGNVRKAAHEIARSIIRDARASTTPVVWVTSNRYVPPMRDFNAAEYVNDAENNSDGELFAFLVELVEDELGMAEVTLEAPEWDNALYAVDLKRWQFREDAADAEDLNDEWEEISGVDDAAENPREI